MRVYGAHSVADSSFGSIALKEFKAKPNRGEGGKTNTWGTGFNLSDAGCAQSNELKTRSTRIPPIRIA
jgi:hypothetical protein